MIMILRECYRCTHRFEVELKAGTEPAKCPQCGSPSRLILARVR